MLLMWYIICLKSICKTNFHKTTKDGLIDATLILENQEYLTANILEETK